MSTNLSSAGSTGAKASPTPANTGCRGEWGFDGNKLKTSGSKAYNKGFGLDTVVTFLKSENMFRMVSNKGLIKLTGKKGSCEMFDIDFDFNGTLIYFDISIDSFEQDFECGSFTL